MSVDEAPLGRRERKKAATRQALTDAALDLFEEKGFTATTIEEITERVDVAPRTFFRYFATKEAVLLPDVEAQTTALVASLAARPTDEPLMDSIVAAFVDGVVLATESRELTARRIAVLDQDEQLRGALTWTALTNGHRVIEQALADHAGLPVTDARIRIAAGAGLLLASHAYDDWLAGGAQADLGQLFRDKYEVLRSLLPVP
jgi:AcrR family transcriptional regulator